MVVSETEFQYLVVRVDEPLQKLGGIEECLDLWNHLLVLFIIRYWSCTFKSQVNSE